MLLFKQVETKVKKKDTILVKLNFCTLEETMTSIQREPTDLETLFAYSSSDKRLICNTLSTGQILQEKTSFYQKMGKIDEQEILQERNINSQRHKKLTISLIIRSHKRELIKKNTSKRTINIREDMRKTDLSFTAGKNADWNNFFKENNIGHYAENYLSHQVNKPDND